MNIPPACRVSALAAALLLPLAFAARAQDTTPPVIVNPIADVTVPVNSPQSVLNIKKTFGLNGVNGTLVRMSTGLGKIDLELFDADAPNTVRNFLLYVTNDAYTDTVFHRSTRLDSAGLAIIQGGETTVQNYTISTITTYGNVANEYRLPNTRGTIAMAKLGGQPDSASDQWFFNVSDNSTTLNESNNGGFTVFGRVIEGDMATVDAINALQTYNLTNVHSSWSDIPLKNYDGANVTPDNLVLASSVDVVPLVSKGDGKPGVLKVSVKGNTNPGLVTPTVVKGKKLILAYTPGQTGTATITLKVKSASKTKIKHSFNVTVQ